MRWENGPFVCKNWTWTQTLHFTRILTQKDRWRKVKGKAEAQGICVALALVMRFQMGCWEHEQWKTLGSVKIQSSALLKTLTREWKSNQTREKAAKTELDTGSETKPHLQCWPAFPVQSPKSSTFLQWVHMVRSAITRSLVPAPVSVSFYDMIKRHHQGNL